jgi:hypothetical protein
MATSLAVQLQLLLNWQQSNNPDLSSVKDTGAISLEDTLANGTAIDQADVLWHDRRTLAATTSEDLDLAASLVSALTGAAVTFAKIKCIYIKNRATTAGYILAVGGASATQFVNWVANSSDILNISPDGFLLLWNPSLAGYAVAASTGDLLKINNTGGGSLDYDIVLIGTSA